MTKTHNASSDSNRALSANIHRFSYSIVTTTSDSNKALRGQVLHRVIVDTN